MRKTLRRLFMIELVFPKRSSNRFNREQANKAISRIEDLSSSNYLLLNFFRILRQSR